MGTVHLTNGHHGLYIRNAAIDPSRRVILDNELLARPLLIKKGHALVDSYCGLIRGALRGLMDLTGFDAAVSFHVIDVGGVPHIMFPHREWGEITYGSPSNVIVAFSHDTRCENSPFRHVSQWLEEQGPHEGFVQDDWERLNRDWSSAERWRGFFERRIQRAIQSWRSEAAVLRHKADALSARVDEILSTLNQSR